MLPSFSDIKRVLADLALQECTANALDKTLNDKIERSKKIFENKLQVLDFLLTNGADPRIGGENEQTPLALLIKEKDWICLGKEAEQVMERFVKHGADINATDTDGFTPLHEAARAGDSVAIEYLIAKGADVNRQSKDKRTPLHCAAERGSQKSTKLLLIKGADPTLCDKDGLTPLQCSEKTLVNLKKNNRFFAEHEYIATQNEIKAFIYNRSVKPTQIYP